MGINAKTENEKSKAKYIALTAECKAEESNLDAINVQRQHEFELKRAHAYEEMSGSHRTKIVMSGSSGEALLGKIFDI